MPATSNKNSGTLTKSEPKDTKTQVLVALSGGVDSAVVLNTLHERYENVTGISHRHWPESKCCTTACIDTCRSQCADLGLPYRTVDTMVEFVENIVTPFVEAYQNGTTPNPCVTCNQVNRFGITLDRVLEQMGIAKSDPWKIASGHYARVQFADGRHRLKRGLDPEKDQSYMLYRLSQEQLSHCLFPLGERVKAEVRETAAKLELESAKKSDSQDICFVPDDYREFLQAYTGTEDLPGEFVDKEGNVLAAHLGIRNYNRGQRKGIGLSGGPWYVVNIDVQTRRITLGTKKDLQVSQFRISDCVWHLPHPPPSLHCQVQLRYHGKVFDCRVEKKEADLFRVTLSEPTVDFSPGQSAVFYDGDTLLGGGVIKNES